MGYTKYTYNRQFFQTIDNEEKAYWLGFIAADGCVATKMNTMRIDLKNTDSDHLEKFRNSIQGNQPIVSGHCGQSCYIDMNSKQVCEDLVKYGVTPKKSLTLDINFNLIPKELIHHFVRGYFDGDGSINYYTRAPYWYDEWEVSFISTQSVLLYFQKLFDLPHKIFTCGQSFRISYKSKADIDKILHYMYDDATIYLERKYQKVQDFYCPQRLPRSDH